MSRPAGICTAAAGEEADGTGAAAPPVAEAAATVVAAAKGAGAQRPPAPADLAQAHSSRAASRAASLWACGLTAAASATRKPGPGRHLRRQVGGAALLH